MASKQLIETESKREFYPTIEIASNEEASTSLPASWGLVKEFVKGYAVSKNGSSAQTITTPIILSNSAGLSTPNISGTIDPETQSKKLNIDASTVNIGGNIDIKSNSISSASDQDSSEIVLGESLDLSGDDINIDATDQLSISGKGGVSITDDQEVCIKAPTTLISNFVNTNNSGTPVGKGSNNKFIYINSSGQFEETTLSSGNNTKPIYISSGSIAESNASVGNSTKFIYMNSGSITESNASVGNSTTFMYLQNGQFVTGTSLSITDVSVPN